MPEPDNAVPPKVRRRKGAERLGALVVATVGPAFSRRGFASTDLATRWAAVVGPGTARYSRPLQMQWPRHGAENGVGATLVVACHPAFALDLQQMAPVLMERINQRLGWRAVARLSIRQMPVTPPAPAQRRLPPSPEYVAAASRITAGIADDRLRALLTRLGAATRARARQAGANGR